MTVQTGGSFALSDTACWGNQQGSWGGFRGGLCLLAGGSLITLVICCTAALFGGYINGK